MGNKSHILSIILKHVLNISNEPALSTCGDVTNAYDVTDFVVV